jgi:putative transposase
MDVKRTKGAVYNLNYHLVWCPKYRRNVLTGRVASRLWQLLDEIATQNGFEVLACKVMPDHVHLFLSTPPKTSASSVEPYSPSTPAKLFKGITARRLRQELGEQIRHELWKPGTLWSPPYYAGTAGNPSTSLRAGSGDVIRRYIEECQHI